jgi:prepilin-type N-terminal cleavage/methylation domain-containing protein
MKRRNSNTAGFTMMEIMIVVVLIGLLAALAIPGFVRARDTSQRTACIVNLRQIDSAAQTWALENKKLSDSPYTLDDIKPYINRNPGFLPECPANGTYSPGATVGDAPTCTGPGHVLPGT